MAASGWSLSNSCVGGDGSIDSVHEFMVDVCFIDGFFVGGLWNLFAHGANGDGGSGERSLQGVFVCGNRVFHHGGAGATGGVDDERGELELSGEGDGLVFGGRDRGGDWGVWGFAGVWGEGFAGGGDGDCFCGGAGG